MTKSSNVCIQNFLFDQKLINKTVIYFKVQSTLKKCTLLVYCGKLYNILIKDIQLLNYGYF